MKENKLTNDAIKELKRAILFADIIFLLEKWFKHYPLKIYEDIIVSFDECFSLACGYKTSFNTCVSLKSALNEFEEHKTEIKNYEILHDWIKKYKEFSYF